MGAVRLLSVRGRAGPGNPGCQVHYLAREDCFKEGKRGMGLEVVLPEVDSKEKQAPFFMCLPCVCVSLPFLSLLPWEQAGAACFQLPEEA